MDSANEKLEADRRLIAEAKEKGSLATVATYTKLSGPGWMQSALTLGGGSLGSSLYLGVIAGFGFLWLQPLAMILGIIMLSAIGYVTMSTGERPFRAINHHISPVLGWGWALASLVANMVWALPQYSLATSVLRQNLFPELLASDNSRYSIVACILILCTGITWSYGSGGWGVKLYERFLKVMVGLIVACFVGVVVKLSLDSHLEWGAIFGGFIPDFSTLASPAEKLQLLLDKVADPDARAHWTGVIVGKQQDVMISAAATAVGINMTFLFPYSLLQRGWGKEFRGLSKFDLSTGMFIPYVLATSCVVIASASQFHGVSQPGLLGETDANGQAIVAPAGIVKDYNKLLGGRVIAFEFAESELDKDALKAAVAILVEKLSPEERKIAATLVTRDAGALAGALKPLTGSFFANVLFGVGVLGMALSTISLLMLISGFVICEIFDLPQGGWSHRLGCLAAATGVLGPFIWSGEAKFWMAVPTSVFGFMLLPIAYFTFFFLMNQRKLLKENMPTGGRRLAWNLLMGIAAGVSGIAALHMVRVKAGVIGLCIAGAFVALALIFRGKGDVSSKAD